MTEQGYTPIEILPEKSMKVEWICEDGTKDIGFYFSDRQIFASWDLLSNSPIIQWKPFNYVFNLPPNQNDNDTERKSIRISE